MNVVHNKVDTAAFNKGKDKLFSKWCLDMWLTICYKIKLEPCFTPYKNLFQMTIMLNKKIKQLDKNVVVYSSNLRWEKALLNIKAKDP